MLDRDSPLEADQGSEYLAMDQCHGSHDSTHQASPSCCSFACFLLRNLRPAGSSLRAPPVHTSPPPGRCGTLRSRITLLGVATRSRALLLWFLSHFNVVQPPQIVHAHSPPTECKKGANDPPHRYSDNPYTRANGCGGPRSREGVKQTADVVGTPARESFFAQPCHPPRYILTSRQEHARRRSFLRLVRSAPRTMPRARSAPPRSRLSRGLVGEGEPPDGSHWTCL